MGASNDLAMVAYDGSSAAQHAVAQAGRLLSARRVMIVTVWEEGLAFVPAPSGLGAIGAVPVNPDVADEIDHAAQEHAERVAREGARLARTVGFDAESLAIGDGGGVGETILGLANQRGAAVIVIGSRGLGGLLARLQGKPRATSSNTPSVPCSPCIPTKTNGEPKACPDQAAAHVRCSARERAAPTQDSPARGLDAVDKHRGAAMQDRWSGTDRREPDSRSPICQFSQTPRFPAC